MKRKRNGETLVERPVSYGVLLYKIDADDCDKKDTKNDVKEIRYLLGLIPQRNWWTVFKGLPNNSVSDDKGNKATETPYETALREFEEETGTKNILESISPETTLKGKTGKKDLVIYLQEGSEFATSSFNIERVVKIDQGYMKGKPEIVEIQWLTLKEALNGDPIRGAKIYTSQQNMLRDAQHFILNKINKETDQSKSEENKSAKK